MRCKDMEMTPEEFRQFLCDEIEEIKRHKWIESERVGHDLGDSAVMDWISKYAAQYRQRYNERLKNQRQNNAYSY